MIDLESTPVLMFFKGGGVNSGAEYRGAYEVEKLIEFANLQMNRGPSNIRVICSALLKWLKLYEFH